MRDNRRVPAVPAMSHKKIESIALTALRRVSPESLAKPGPVPIDDILDRRMPHEYGFRLVITPLPEGYEGVMDSGTLQVHVSPEIFVGMGDGNGRARFCGGHELGHVVLHARYLRAVGAQLVDGRSKPLYRRKSIPAYRDPEVQANRFSSAFMMPAPMVREVVRATCGDAVEAVSRTFHMSYTAAGYRVEQVCG